MGLGIGLELRDRANRSRRARARNSVGPYRIAIVSRSQTLFLFFFKRTREGKEKG